MRFTDKAVEKRNLTADKFWSGLASYDRYEAHKRLESKTVRGRIIDVSPQTVRHLLGKSSPF